MYGFGGTGFEGYKEPRGSLKGFRLKRFEQFRRFNLGFGMEGFRDIRVLSYGL